MTFFEFLILAKASVAAVIWLAILATLIRGRS